jgi:hypothetical protein
MQFIDPNTGYQAEAAGRHTVIPIIIGATEPLPCIPIARV